MIDDALKPLRYRADPAHIGRFPGHRVPNDSMSKTV